jgi:hypothetical protein
MIAGNPEIDFLEQNPMYKYVGFFSDIYKKEKKKASKILWALYLLEDPSSPIYNMPREIRLEEISIRYFKIDKEKVDLYRRGFIDSTMTKEYKLYKIAYDKLTDLTYDLEGKDLNDEVQWNQTLKLMEKLSKLWDSMDALKVKYEESIAKSTMKGGGALSAREKRNAG